MAMADHTRIAFVGGRGGAHSTSFDAFVPPEVVLETVRLSPRAESPGDSRQAQDVYAADVVALLGEHRWNGAALVGTPTHVRFPNALAHIRDALDLPVTSPLESGVEALRALGWGGRPYSARGVWRKAAESSMGLPCGVFRYARRHSSVRRSMSGRPTRSFSAHRRSRALAQWW